MDRWPQDVDEWLANEQNASDEAAEAAFARVMASLPLVTPGEDFVQRAVAASLPTPERSRRTSALLRIAAGLLLAAASAFASYGIALDAGSSVVATAAVFSSQLFVRLVSTAGVALDWWLITAHVGDGVASIVLTPPGIAALAILQVLTACALFLLRRLLAGDASIRRPRAFCF
jgi:hypothetical protein